MIPAGKFERTTKVVDGIERSIIVPGSFQYLEETKPQSWQVFSAIFEGFVDKADIVVFILLIGGAFWIINTSKSIDVGIFSMLRFTKRLERTRWIRALGINNIIITLIMLMFSIFGAVFGMSEETIAFIIIFVPLAISMGYDSIVGVSMCFVGAGLGFAGALLNPFTIGIAQGLSDLELYTGIEYRMFCWAIINAVGIGWVLWYANRIKRNPKRSPVYENDDYWRKRSSSDTTQVNYHTPVAAWFVFGFITIALLLWSFVGDGFTFEPRISTLNIGGGSYTMPAMPVLTGLFIILSVFTLRKSVHFFILNLLLFTILFLIIGVMGYHWYVMEIATLFFAMGIFSGISMHYSANKITQLFLEGVKDILSAAMIVGLAGGILVILEKGQVIDSILHSIAQSMHNTEEIGSISVMYGIQTFINIIIPSGSAKAALTMPMMSQFSDLIGVSRQATVMAFQFGDGFTNMITPTSGVLLGVLSVAKIPYEKWVKWIWPFMAILMIVGFLLLIPTVTMTLNGF
jgi:uncharacterized ion transporter superfamily protein YfcC